MHAACRRIALTAVLLVAATQPARAQSAECDPGEREVRSLEFHGNTVFRASDLALRVATTPSDFARRNLRIFGQKRCLDSDELRLDVGRLRVFYRRHGYFSTKVDTVVTALKDGYGGVKVAFEIREGDPVHVDTIRISGLDSITRPIVDTSDLNLRAGIVFDVTRLQGAIDSMKARLRNSGYPRGDVAASFSTPDTALKRVSVNVDILPGDKAYIGAIHVVDEPLPGAPRRLSDNTILGVAALQKGALYRERDVVDAQRRLYQSDLFLHADVSPATDSSSRTTDSTIVMNVTVGENYLRQVITEEGWAVLDCFKARAQYIDKSFLGEGRRVEFTGQLSKMGYGEPTRVLGGNLCAPAIRADTFSAKINYFAGTTIRLPSIFGLPTSPSLSVYSERRSEYQAFLRTTIVGGEASVNVLPLRDMPLRLAYSLEYGRTEAQPALLCAVFNRCDSESRALLTDHDRPLAIVSGHLERLRTDNPFNPRSGTTLRLDLRAAAKAVGSDKDFQFVKGLVDASAYRAVTSGVTLAARVRLGSTIAFGNSTGFIPPEERLYAGGAQSVRGFQQNELGDLIYIAEDSAAHIAGMGDTVYLNVPADARLRRVVPVGGNSLIVANFEARVRSPFLPELIQYTFFADAGDVWQRSSAIGTGDRKASALFLNALRWTPGIGIRVFTPVGPFQANIGYNPYARPPGAIYYDAAPNPVTGFAPLYCVSPGNRVPALPSASGTLEQTSGVGCPATFSQNVSSTFLGRLNFTFSIGPDF
ncbi:MAG: bacterial surface antigen family protein [Gemmatimonadetes bacterium]|nr:bacterial surface antigen family protein [Gemmatimonadota bacterium]